MKKIFAVLLTFVSSHNIHSMDYVYSVLNFFGLTNKPKMLNLTYDKKNGPLIRLVQRLEGRFQERTPVNTLDVSINTLQELEGFSVTGFPEGINIINYASRRRIIPEPAADGKEFLENDNSEMIYKTNCISKERPMPHITDYCYLLDEYDQDGTELSKKQQALLHFARIMAEKEKEWTSWCTIQDDRIIQIQNHDYKSMQMHVYKPKNRQKPYLRQDIHSPYYKNIEKNTYDNASENTTFHDELRFLETQQHKMELYWNIKPEEEKKSQYNDYRKTLNLIKQEIAAFKKDKNRIAFTRSCLNNSKFILVQESRKAYQKE